MPQVTLTSARVDEDGSVHFQFGKREHVFNSIEHARGHVRSVLDRETLDMLAIALVLSRQPNLGNPGAFAGKSLDVDLSRNNWGQIV